MTDYRLDRLSPRLFEHVVQALAVGAITSTTTPFGDGPDGGREATFEGETNYGPAHKPWNGYGIIQAKYHIRSQDPTRDAKWACTELTKELKQYTRTSNPRATPKYYIFATNVVLSPGENGGKDKVRKILQEFALDRSIEFDIWDYDKIRVLIDRDEAVRRAYMAWISPSDVLAELCDYLGARKKDYYKIIVRYLQRELLADQYAQLEQAGHSADEAIPLSQVFIDLPTSLKPTTADGLRRPDPDDGRRFVSRIVHESGYSLRAKEFDVRRPAPTDASTGSYQHGRIGRSVLIGGPGQGKTTIAQYICQVFRCALLSDVYTHLLDPNVSNTLHDFMSGWSAEGNEPPAARRLPFRVVLSDFAKGLAAGNIKSLMGYLASKLCASTEMSLSADEVEHVLTRYPSIIILDGLDEVPSSTNREEVLAAVSNFSIDVATGNLDSFIIATSRPQGYNEEFSPQQYIHHYLTPLTQQDALAYGDRLAKIRFGTNEDRFHKITRRLRRAVAKPATARLMQTPLQVTILTLLVDRMGDPPEERWSLFREYYQLIYERETERDIESVLVLKEHRVDVDAIHRRVGIALQVESERSGGTDARLTLSQFGQIVEDYLLEEGHAGNTLQALKKRIIDAAAYRLVFLVGLEAGQVGFEIRSLQEFMAAEGIMDGRDETIRNRLRAISSSSHWRNVFLFASGKCFSDRRYLRDTIQSICAELNDDPVDESLRTLLVGSELALDLLEDGPARRTPLTRGTLTRLALQLLGSPFRGVTRIASVCEPDTCYVYLEDLRERLSGEDCLSSRQAWTCLAALVDRYGGDFEQLARQVLARRPISDQEFEYAVEAASGENPWLSRALYEVVKERALPLDIDSGIEEEEEFAGEQERYVGPWLISEYPQWFEWYVNYNELYWNIDDNVNIRLVGERDKMYYAIFRRIAVVKDSAFTPPNGLPETVPWQLFRRVGDFYRAPSATTLAAVARDIVTEPVSDASLKRLIPHYYPWPLAEILLTMRSYPNLPIAELIESGSFGDVREWSELEEKVLEGISLRDLLDYPMIIPTEDGGLYRFPFRAAALMTRIVPARAVRSDVGVDVIPVFDRTESTVIRRFLSEIIFRSIRADYTRRRFPWMDRVLFFHISYLKRLDALFYRYANFVDLLDHKWSDLFSGFRPSAIGVTHITIGKEFLLKLAKIVDARDDLRGLLVPLACGLLEAPRAVRSDIIAGISVPIEGSSAIRAAAVIINIMAGADIERLHNNIAELLMEDDQLFRVLVSAVRSRDLPYKRELQQLMALVHVAHQDRIGAWSVLTRNFERRPSKLLETGEWSRLEFPSSMRLILGLSS